MLLFSPTVIKTRGVFINNENDKPGATPGGKRRIYDFEKHGPNGASSYERMNVYAECMRVAFSQAF